MSFDVWPVATTMTRDFGERSNKDKPVGKAEVEDIASLDAVATVRLLGRLL